MLILLTVDYYSWNYVEAIGGVIGIRNILKK